MWKGGPLDCGLPEFGGRPLNEGVWVGFRPSSLEEVSECRGMALGGGVWAGLGLCAAGGRLRRQRIRPGSPTGFLVLKCTGKAPAEFPSLPSCPFPIVSPRVSPHHCWTLNCEWVPLCVGTPPLPQPPLKGAGPRGLAFTFAPPSLLPTTSGPGGAQAVDRGKLAMLSFDLLPSQWSSNVPLRAWDPFPSPSHPSGAPVLTRFHFSSSLTAPMPHILPGHWGFLPSP